MYIESKTELQKPEILSPVENLVMSFTELAKLNLKNIKEVTKANKAARELIISNAELKIANIENTQTAQGITAIVDQSVLFRSLGGGE